MSEREELAEIVAVNSMLADPHEDWRIADAILASDWLAARDARIREDALRPVRALAEDWESTADTLRDQSTVEAQTLDGVVWHIRAVIDTPAQADGGEVR